MDKLRPILEKLRKHHFWLLALTALLTGLVGWYMASGSLSAAYDANKAKIVGKFTNLDGILKTEDHPNAKWKEEIDKITLKEKDYVRTAWETVYNEQKQHLTWPPELGKAFVDFAEKSKPDEEFELDFRTRYQDLILKTEFPRLLAIVGAKDEEAGKSTTAQPGAPAPPPRAAGAALPPTPETGTDFVWEGSSQSEVKRSLFFPTTPTSAQLRQTQEDIWVYRSLLQIVQAMNDKQYVPVVKRLSVMEIGKKAGEAYQKGMGPGHIVVMQPAGATPTPELPAPPPAEAAEGAEPAPDEGRYVDATGKPLAAGEGAKQQYKRLPVFLKLNMDQRQLTKLLAECANSPLPLEVRQLRFGAKESSSGGANKSAAATPSAADSHEVAVELNGIIYLYNPPDPEKLGAPAGAAATAGGPAAPGGAPGTM
jgi:hypothetical protein